jgi:protocatechuate 4,5-dioxygenase alpha subunit
MKSIPHWKLELADIPGTTVFTGAQARRGFSLNQFCMSLMQEANRARFRADEDAYLDEWKLTEAQKAAVKARDYNEMIEHGGNIYFLAKIGATDGLSVQHIVGTMTGMSADEYRDMMLAGGRSPEGQRSKSANLEQRLAA